MIKNKPMSIAQLNHMDQEEHMLGNIQANKAPFNLTSQPRKKPVVKTTLAPILHLASCRWPDTREHAGVSACKAFCGFHSDTTFLVVHTLLLLAVQQRNRRMRVTARLQSPVPRSRLCPTFSAERTRPHSLLGRREKPSVCLRLEI